VQLREAYSILGVEPGFAPEEIRSRYRLLVKELHPDVHGGRGLELGQIIEAYRLIDARLGAQFGTARRSGVRRSAARRGGNHGARGGPGAGAGVAGSGTGPGKRSGDARRPASARDVVSFGKIAVSSGDTVARVRALRALTRSGLRSAGVFVRQCLFDADKTVAEESARLFPLIPGVRGESVLIELFDQLSEAQCLAIVETVGKQRRDMRRFLAYASADSRLRVRMRAMEVLRGD